MGKIKLKVPSFKFIEILKTFCDLQKFGTYFLIKSAVSTIDHRSLKNSIEPQNFP